MGTLLAILILIVFMVTPAIAAPPDVMTIMKQMKEVFEPVRPSARKVVISVDYKEGKVQWTATQARKKFPDGKRMLMVMLEPEDIRGLAILYWEPENKPGVMWLYVPALRRVRQLRPVEEYEHFLGTDFTYADLGFTRLHEQYKLLGEEELAGGRTYKVEEKILQEGFYYSRIVNWIAADSMLPLRRDYFDLAGMLWKTELFEASVINRVPTPVRILMKDLQRGFGSELNVTTVDYDIEIPNEAFKPELLPEVVKCPL